MERIKLLLLVFMLGISLSGISAKKYKVAVVETNMGTMKIRLYENTPKHSENFLKLVKEKHYDNLLFHRVIENFMIQGGASDSRGAKPEQMVGVSNPGYMLEPEFRQEYFHRKGVLAAAREGDEVNPEKKSSGEQFYIVQGKVYTDEELNAIQNHRLIKAKNELGVKLFTPRQEEYKRYFQAGEKAKADSLIRGISTEIEKQFTGYDKHVFPANIREIYKTIGGTPFLDGEYTVFGEVIEGLEVIDKIAAVKTNPENRPVEDVVILKITLKSK